MLTERGHPCYTSSQFLSLGLDTLGTCLIYSGSFVGLDLEYQPEQTYSLDISSQLAEQWSDLVGQCKDMISSMSRFFMSVLISLEMYADVFATPQVSNVQRSILIINVNTFKWIMHQSNVINMDKTFCSLWLSFFFSFLMSDGRLCFLKFSFRLLRISIINQSFCSSHCLPSLRLHAFYID